MSHPANAADAPCSRSPVDYSFVAGLNGGAVLRHNATDCMYIGSHREWWSLGVLTRHQYLYARHGSLYAICVATFRRYVRMRGVVSYSKVRSFRDAFASKHGMTSRAHAYLDGFHHGAAWSPAGWIERLQPPPQQKQTRTPVDEADELVLCIRAVARTIATKRSASSNRVTRSTA